MCLKGDFDAWRKGETFLNTYPGKGGKQFVTKDEIIAAITDTDLSLLDDDEFINFLSEDGNYNTYDQYFDRELEDFEDTFTTPNGDIVVAFGVYGNDY
jgi:hypothetical protein